MMAEKNISVSNQTVKRMLSVADSFDETADSLINRLLDFYDLHRPASGMAAAKTEEFRLVLNPLAPPSLRHTRLTFAKLDGQELVAPSWNGLAEQAVRLAWKRLRSFPALQMAAHANMVEGMKRDHGYRYLAELDLSLQGQDANGAWRCVAQLAQSQGFRAEVGFLWRDNPAAAYPGQVGHMTVGGPK